MAPKGSRVWWVWISVLYAGTVAGAAEQGQSSKDTGQGGDLGGTASAFTSTAETTDRNVTWVATNTAASTGGGPTTPNTTVLILVKDTTGRKTRQLSKPAIAIHSGEGSCNVTLTCTPREGGGDVTYVWHQPGKSHVLSTGPVLRITQKPPDGFLNYTCTVNNMASKNSSTVSLREHCHGAAASSSVKFWVPPVFMAIALITLYFTYRKTTERESRSRAGSIAESSESDSQDNQAVHGEAQVIPHPEAWNRADEETRQAKGTLTTQNNEPAPSDPDPAPQPGKKSLSTLFFPGTPPVPPAPCFQPVSAGLLVLLCLSLSLEVSLLLLCLSLLLQKHNPLHPDLTLLDQPAGDREELGLAEGPLRGF